MGPLHGLNGWIEVDDGSDDCPYRVRYESGAAARKRDHREEIVRDQREEIELGPGDLGRWWFAVSDLVVLQSSSRTPSPFSGNG